MTTNQRTMARLVLTIAAISVAIIATLAATGVPLPEGARGTTVLTVGALACGILWGIVRGHRSVDVLELVGMGLALFSVSYALIRVSFASFDVHPPVWLVLAGYLAVSFAGWGVLGRRGRTFEAVVRLPTMAAVAIGLTLLTLVSLPSLLRYSPDSYDDFNPDLYFFESLANAVSQFGPTEGGLLSDWPVRYHWLAYALGGSLTEDAALSPFSGLTHLLPLVASLVLACVAAVWVHSIGSATWTPAVAVLVLLVGTSVGSSGNRIINWDSPSQSMASAWLAGLLLATALYLRRQSGPWAVPVVALLTFALAIGKASHAGIALAALALVALGGLLTGRRWRWRALLLLSTASLLSAAAYLLFISGQSDGGSLELSPLVSTLTGEESAEGTLFGGLMLAAGLLLGVLPRWFGLVPMLAEPAARRGLSIEVFMALGAVISAVAVVLLITNEGSNQSWFVDAACVPLGIVSAMGLDRAWTMAQFSPTGTRIVTAALAVASLALAVVAVVTSRHSPLSDSYPLGIPAVVLVLATWLVAAGAAAGAITLSVRSHASGAPRWVFWAVITGLFMASSVLATLVRVVPYDRPPASQSGSATRGVQDLVPALSWLRANADTDDIVATDFDSEAFSGALSGLRPYAEWERYAALLSPTEAGGTYEARRDAIRDFLSTVGREGSPVLCRDGVDWLIVESDTPLPAALNSSIARIDERFTVLRLPC